MKPPKFTSLSPEVFPSMKKKRRSNLLPLIYKYTLHVTPFSLSFPTGKLPFPKHQLRTFPKITIAGLNTNTRIQVTPLGWKVGKKKESIIQLTTSPRECSTCATVPGFVRRKAQDRALSPVGAFERQPTLAIEFSKAHRCRQSYHGKPG